MKYKLIQVWCTCYNQMIINTIGCFTIVILPPCAGMGASSQKLPEGDS